MTVYIVNAEGWFYGPWDNADTAAAWSQTNLVNFSWSLSVLNPPMPARCQPAIMEQPRRRHRKKADVPEAMP